MIVNINKVGTRLGSIDDLPEELKRHLQTNKPDELGMQIIHLLNEMYEGVASIDEVLVGLYRQTLQIHTRAFITNKLYRMAQNQLIKSVPKKKGVYATNDAVISTE